MKAYLILFLSFLPTPALPQGSKSNFSDLKNPGIYAFLTETYKPVSDFKILPANTLIELEEFERNAEEQRGPFTFGKDGHFYQFKLDGAGISKNSCYVYFQSSHSPAYHYLGVLQKRAEGFYVSFYTELPTEMHDTSLSHLRDMILESYRRDVKFGMIDIHWKGDYKNGWANHKRNIHIRISKDLRSINAKDLNGKLIWNCDLIGIMEKNGMWNGKENTFGKEFELLYPKAIGQIEIGDKEIHCYYASKCFGVIDLSTGGFMDEGCD